jgi:hypothetical protein
MIVKRHINGVSTCCAKACRVYRQLHYGKATLLYQCLGCMGWCDLERTGNDMFEIYVNVDLSVPLE